jgi:ABC-type bacteriocin/lantibiotic exporter with double-glycine peptidase domain
MFSRMVPVNSHASCSTMPTCERISYSPDEPLIEDLSFTAEPGRTVAIVGPTGAGKTTLVNLVKVARAASSTSSSVASRRP